jgi:hypothetical protein
MSDMEFEGEGFEPGFEEGDGGAGELDPFDPGFGTNLGQAVSEAVEGGVQQAVEALLGRPSADDPAFGFEPGWEPEPTAEDEALVARGEQVVSGWLDGFRDGLGPFDQRAAADYAEGLFPQLQAEAQAQGVQLDEQELAWAATLGGAIQAANDVRGGEFADQLARAEQLRVGSVDRDAVLGMSSEIMEQALEQGVIDRTTRTARTSERSRSKRSAPPPTRFLAVQAATSRPSRSRSTTGRGRRWRAG